MGDLAQTSEDAASSRSSGCILCVSRAEKSWLGLEVHWSVMVTGMRSNSFIPAELRTTGAPTDGSSTSRPTAQALQRFERRCGCPADGSSRPTPAARHAARQGSARQSSAPGGVAGHRHVTCRHRHFREVLRPGAVKARMSLSMNGAGLVGWWSEVATTISQQATAPDCKTESRGLT